MRWDHTSRSDRVQQQSTRRFECVHRLTQNRRPHGRPNRLADRQRHWQRLARDDLFLLNDRAGFERAETYRHARVGERWSPIPVDERAGFGDDDRGRLARAVK